MSTSSLRAVARVVVGLALAACAAVYPELQTPVRAPPPGKVADRTPGGFRYVAVLRAKVPDHTRDGRAWDSVGDTAPDPYVVVAIDGRAIIRTPTRSDTLTPTWDDAPAGNFPIPASARLRVELWDSNPVKDRPIGVRELSVGALEPSGDGTLEVECDSGAIIVLAWRPPEMRWGLGFAYELQTYDAVVTRVFEESPASHAGMRPGDRIVAVDHEVVRGMKAGELQTRLHASRAEGVLLRVQRRDKSTTEIRLEEGPIFPLWDELHTALR